MTKWIERYRREAEERFRRIDRLLEELDHKQHKPTRKGKAS